MTVSFAEAAAAAHRIQGRSYTYDYDGDAQRNRDALLLAGFVLAGDTERLRAALERAAFVAEHLLAMIPREVWRDSGGDDGQGHYEGDYHAAETASQIRAWKALAGGACDALAS